MNPLCPVRVLFHGQSSEGKMQIGYGLNHATVKVAAFLLFF